MSTVATRPAHRFWFLVDATVTGANAVAYVALHQVLLDLLGAGPVLYLAAGAVLAMVTVGLVAVASSASRPPALPEALAVINIVWAVGSFVVAIANPFDLTTAGVVWAVAQGVAVLAFAVLQLRVLRSAW